jgi:hypothetical protein
VFQKVWYVSSALVFYLALLLGRVASFQNRLKITCNCLVLILWFMVVLYAYK